MEVVLTNDPVDLIRACLRGDIHACSALFEEYRGLVYHTAYLMFENSHDAEDALQEVFLQVFRSLDTYDPTQAAFSTWLHRVTVNYCLSRWRVSRRARSVSLSQIDPLVAHPADDPLAALAATEQASRLLGDLNADQRTIVILRFYWDLSYREIATITGVELGTVQSRLNRALKKMRSAMQAMAEETRQ